MDTTTAADTRRAEIGPWIGTAILIAANIVPWFVLANPAYLVAQTRDVLLGRYAVGQLTTLLTVALLSIPGLILIWAPRPRRKKRAIQLAALIVSVVVTFIAFDGLLRLMRPARYVVTGAIRHRRPNHVFKGVTHDVPKAAFSYPNPRGGYPDIPYTLTTDDRGFRNAATLDRADVVVLGDSYAEGSESSDEHAWPVLLAQRTGLSVCSLAMAGGEPQSYLAALAQIGLKLHPQIVIVMLYEGNDFRAAKAKRDVTLSRRFRNYRKRSPLRAALKQAMIRGLGPVGVERIDSVPRDHALWPVAWLPLAVGDGDETKYYALEWKRFAANLATREAFGRSAGFKATADALIDMKALCDAQGIRLIVAYAPDKPHITLSVAADRLDAEQIHAFLALKMNDPPGADRVLGALKQGCEAREAVLADFCRDAGIEFHSPTKALRDRMAAGTQVYFTYDQHWTPEGNQVVADSLSRPLAGVTSRPAQQAN